MLIAYSGSERHLHYSDVRISRSARLRPSWEKTLRFILFSMHIVVAKGVGTVCVWYCGP